MNESRNDFVAAHIGKYGLTGSNTIHNDPKYPKLERNNRLNFSRQNHFVWGYNGEQYTNRRSSTCMGDTDYRRLRNTGSVLPLDACLIDIAEQVCRKNRNEGVVIVNRGRFEDYAFVDAFRQATPHVYQIILDEGGTPLYEHDPYVPAIPFELESDYMRNVIASVVPWLRTKSRDVILDVAMTRNRYLGDTLVFPSRMKFVNHNFDGDQACGPAYWALCDSEEDTALMRYSCFEPDTQYIHANMGLWSPDLIASQLTHDALKDCFARNDIGTADEATDEMWRSVSPFKEQFTNYPTWWNQLDSYIEEEHDNGKYDEKWYTPVHRLHRRLGIPFEDEKTVQTYGTVDLDHGTLI